MSWEFESRNQKVQALKAEASGASQALKDFRKGAAWQNLQKLQAEFTETTEKLRKAEAGLSSLILPLFRPSLKDQKTSRKRKIHPKARN